MIKMDEGLILTTDFPKIDKSWTLFLDRDGVINERLPGRYVQFWNEFCFCKGVVNVIPDFNTFFKRIFIVTNQQGIGKKLMTSADLQQIHDKMLVEIERNGGSIDAVYFCPELEKYNPICRKPNPGMALAAKEAFPEIDFEKSVMVGDSLSDMVFGKQLNMKTVFISSREEKVSLSSRPDLIFPDLKSFGDFLANR